MPLGAKTKREEMELLREEMAAATDWSDYRNDYDPDWLDGQFRSPNQPQNQRIANDYDPEWVEGRTSTDRTIEKDIIKDSRNKIPRRSTSTTHGEIDSQTIRRNLPRILHGSSSNSKTATFPLRPIPPSKDKSQEDMDRKTRQACNHPGCYNNFGLVSVGPFSPAFPPFGAFGPDGRPLPSQNGFGNFQAGIHPIQMLQMDPVASTCGCYARSPMGLETDLMLSQAMSGGLGGALGGMGGSIGPRPPLPPPGGLGGGLGGGFGGPGLGGLGGSLGGPGLAGLGGPGLGGGLGGPGMGGLGGGLGGPGLGGFGGGLGGPGLGGLGGGLGGPGPGGGLGTAGVGGIGPGLGTGFPDAGVNGFPGGFYFNAAKGRTTPKMLILLLLLGSILWL